MPDQVIPLWIQNVFFDYNYNEMNMMPGYSKFAPTVPMGKSEDYVSLQQRILLEAQDDPIGTHENPNSINVDGQKVIVETGQRSTDYPYSEREVGDESQTPGQDPRVRGMKVLRMQCEVNRDVAARALATGAPAGNRTAIGSGNAKWSNLTESSAPDIYGTIWGGKEKIFAATGQDPNWFTCAKYDWWRIQRNPGLIDVWQENGSGRRRPDRLRQEEFAELFELDGITVASLQASGHTKGIWNTVAVLHCATDNVEMSMNVPSCVNGVKRGMPMFADKDNPNRITSRKIIMEDDFGMIRVDPNLMQVWTSTTNH